MVHEHTVDLRLPFRGDFDCSVGVLGQFAGGNGAPLFSPTVVSPIRSERRSSADLIMDGFRSQRLPKLGRRRPVQGGRTMADEFVKKCIDLGAANVGRNSVLFAPLRADGLDLLRRLDQFPDSRAGFGYADMVDLLALIVTTCSPTRAISQSPFLRTVIGLSHAFGANASIYARPSRQRCAFVVSP